MKIKKKDLITAIIIALVLAAILFSAVYLSMRHRFTDKTFNAGAIGSYTQTSGKHLYFNKNGTLMRYDSENDTVTKPCGHTKGNNKCILEDLSGDVSVYGNRVYFSYHTDKLGMNTDVAYFDIKTEKTHTLGVNNSGSFYIYDGSVYYVDIELSAICRIPASGGSAETLVEDITYEKIFAAADGKIFSCYTPISFSSMYPTIYTSCIYSYDIETLEKRELASFQTDSMSPIKKSAFSDGTVYFQISLWRATINSEFLYTLDTETDEINRILVTNINTFYLTDKGICYFPYKERNVYAPNLYLSDENGMFPVLKSPDLYFCNFNGENIQTIYTNPNVSFESVYWINGKFFGLFVGTADGIEENEFYASINVDQGKFKEIRLPE